MANGTSETKILPLSTSLANLVRPVLKEMCSEYEWESGSTYCVSANKIAKRVIARHRKQLAKALTNQTVLYSLIMAAVNAGQFAGFGLRRGRNGGVYAE